MEHLINKSHAFFLGGGELGKVPLLLIKLREGLGIFPWELAQFKYAPWLSVLSPTDKAWLDN